MQTHLNLYQYNAQRLAQLRQEATANALARQTGMKPSWLVRLQQVFLPRPSAPLPPCSSAPQPPCRSSSHAQATPKTAH